GRGGWGGVGYPGGGVCGGTPGALAARLAPRSRGGPAAAVAGDRTAARCGDLYTAARALATTIATQVSGTPRPHMAGRDRPRRLRRWRTGLPLQRPHVPSVYRIDTPSAVVARPSSAPPHAATGATVTGPATGLAEAEPALAEPVVVPGSPTPALSVQVFGRLRVLWTTGPGAEPIDIDRYLRPRERQLLTALAVNPHGATRAALIDAIWGDQCPKRPANALSTLLSRLRTAITTATGGTITHVLDGDKIRYRLDPDLWRVDYHDFDAAVTALHTATTDHDRERACRAILDAAGGVLGEDVTADWITPIREAARRDRLKALGKLAATLVDTDPDQTLALLETALIADPCNEPIYQDILRLHARLGERTAIDPTLSLLRRRLEHIGDIPTQKTLDIAQALRNQQHRQSSIYTAPDTT
uniref:AfsR/SARP family transcriptional regulator n=1 Tax=Nocardia wallacei TaxID=480035 RepID=UPI002456C199